MVTMTEMYIVIFPNFMRKKKGARGTRKIKRNRKKLRNSKRQERAYAFSVREGGTYTEVSQGLHRSGH